MANTNLEKLKRDIELYNHFEFIYLTSEFAFPYDFKRAIDDKIFLPDYGINLQRDYVWNIEHKTALIKNLMYNIPVQPLTVVQVQGAKIFWLENNFATLNFIIDGKQRLNAVLEYQQDLFPVEGVYYSELKGSGISINGKLRNFVYYLNSDYPNFINENPNSPLHDDTVIFFDEELSNKTIAKFRLPKKLQQEFMKLFLRTNYNGVPQNNKHLHLIHNLLEEKNENNRIF